MATVPSCGRSGMGSLHGEDHAGRQLADGGLAAAAYSWSSGAGDWDIWILRLVGTGAASSQKSLGAIEGEVCWSVA
jgi:hypothetical protein